MPSVDLERLITNAKVHLPGALDTALQLEFFAVMKEFLDLSNVWRDRVSFQVTPTSNTPHTDPQDFIYELSPVSGRINRLINVLNEEGTPIAAVMPIPGQIRLLVSPNSETVYTAELALTVGEPSVDNYPDVPEWIIEKYMEGLLDGVVGRMMSQVAKPYSSPSMADVHMRRFRQAIGRAKMEVQRGGQYRGARWRFPRFAN